MGMGRLVEPRRARTADKERQTACAAAQRLRLPRPWNGCIKREATAPTSLLIPSVAAQAPKDRKNGFHTAIQNAGIENFRWADLRHTFASWLVMRGASMRAVSELLGHQSMQMTMRYAHLTPGYLSSEVSL